MNAAKAILGAYMVVVGALCGCDSVSVDKVPAADEELRPQESGEGAASQEETVDFVGEWVGTYGCKIVGIDPIDDVLLIERGDGEGEYVVTLHADAANPSVVVGTARGSDAIVVAKQRMGGMQGTAEIFAEGAGLRLKQGGFGMYCEGTYRRASP